MTFCPMTINRIHFITFETELKFEVYIKRVYKRLVHMELIIIFSNFLFEVRKYLSKQEKPEEGLYRGGI